jgi:hypothetical protein
LVKCLLFRRILTKIGKCRQILLKISITNIPENAIGGSVVAPCGKKDGRKNMTRVIVALRNYFAEAPVNYGTILTLADFSPRYPNTG